MVKVVPAGSNVATEILRIDLCSMLKILVLGSTTLENKNKERKNLCDGRDATDLVDEDSGSFGAIVLLDKHRSIILLP